MSYAAHVTSRDDKNEIAKQFYKDKINGKHKVDVLLGGGAKLVLHLLIQLLKQDQSTYLFLLHVQAPSLLSACYCQHRWIFK
jgi:alkaline phosphatase